MYSPDSDTNWEKCVSNNDEEHEEVVVPSNMKCYQSRNWKISILFQEYESLEKSWQCHKSHKIVRHKRYFKSFWQTKIIYYQNVRVGVAP